MQNHLLLCPIPLQGEEKLRCLGGWPSYKTHEMEKIRTSETTCRGSSRISGL